VRAWTPRGAATERFLRERRGEESPAVVADAESDVDASYLGWEIGRCAGALEPEDQRALAAIAAAWIGVVRGGSTRMRADEEGLASALTAVGAVDCIPRARALLERVRGGDPAVSAILGRPGERKPLLLDGAWLYAERMRALEERFCVRVLQRLSLPPATPAGRSLSRALEAVSAGPPPLTDEQKRAVRAALVAPLALVTGGPGTGKTTIVVALLRALAWLGVKSEAIAIAAPTGKAANRLKEAIAAGLAAQPRDLVDAGLRAHAPPPVTLHRLLGWSPSSGRFARHENDPLPHQVVIVDESAMVDLGVMDRLVRALRVDARLVLLGDADQLPSVDAGAVFRDLCASVGAVRLTVNLRVARDPAARRLVAAAEAVNAGTLDARFTDAVEVRRSAKEVKFEGVEHLAGPWSEVGGDLLERWWTERVASLDSFTQRASRVYRAHRGVFDDAEIDELRTVFDHLARARILCATRAFGHDTGAEAINARLLARLRGGRWRAGPPGRAQELAPGTPVLVQRNDYERGLFNGDQGLVVRLDDGDAGQQLAVAFPRGPRDLEAFPLDALRNELTAAFAMTVHKAQGSEFDVVALVLPDEDMPLLTRELVYTALTRARSAALLAGSADLLARTVSRSVDRNSGVGERLSTARRH
jgi:exodeoxyribonuclease V alpha subunit